MEPSPANLRPDASLQDMHPDDSPHDMDHPVDDTPFTECRRKKKRHRSGASDSSQNTIVSVVPSLHSLTVILKPTDSTKLVKKLNPIKLSQYLESIAPDGVIEIRPNQRLNLLALDTRNRESTKALLGVTSICGIPVQAYQPRCLDTAVGVIRGLPSDMSDDEILDATRGSAQAVKARRLGTSEVVQIVFQTSTLPEHVCVGYTRYRVLPYIEKPRQCTNCNRFGHISSTCLMPLRCVRCGKAHNREACTADQPRCPNCKKQHESTSRRCPSFQAEEAISVYRSTHHVSYVAARAAIAGDDTHKLKMKHIPNITSQPSARVGIATRKHTEDVDSDESRASRTCPREVENKLVKNNDTFPSLPHHSEPAVLANSSQRQRRSRKTPEARAPTSNTSSTNVGTALQTILSMLRDMLELINLPFARSIITILDAVLPLTRILAC